MVLGGHVNGYSIVKELYEQGIKDIAIFDYARSLARFSNKTVYHSQIDNDPETLLKELTILHGHYDYIVIFPTDDLEIENLHLIYEEVSDFCYLPFNHENILDNFNKFFQYQACESINVPYPKTIHAKNKIDLESIVDLTFPLLIKPSTRKDSTTEVFRNLYLEGKEDYLSAQKMLVDFITNGIEFVVSEFIPGDDTNIYAYTCFRSQDGEILNEWSGKKLTQYPDNYGVVCSSSNQAPQEVVDLGRALVEKFDAAGIIEPEFKYDYRDGKYKLMETNFRSMMWHRTGSISGVKLHETQYNYATGRHIQNYNQDASTSIHFVLMLHEIPNLIARKGYFKYFRHNVFGGDRRVWAIFEWGDVKPFLFSLVYLFLMGGGAFLRRFGLR